MPPADGPASARRMLVVDGTNVLYRSHHALAGTGLSHAGRPVWAVHGLIVTLSRFLRTGEFTHALIAFDTPGGCPARRSLQPAYKQTRTPPAAELAYQLQWAPMILQRAGLATWAVTGWEADDGLASAALAASPHPVVVVTSDRDAYQLIDDRVTMALPDLTRVTPVDVHAKWGVGPAGYPHVAALRGEPSDNLPGVPGVGAKTASKLIAEFGTLDSVLSAPDAALRPFVGPKTLAAIRTDGGIARLTLDVGRLRTDLPVDWETGTLARIDMPALESELTLAGLPRAASLLSDALRITS